MSKSLLLFAMLTTFSACTWVQLTSEGAGVRLAPARMVSNCERVGRTTASTLSEIVTVDRGGGKLQSELLTLARNEAGRMGGNTIVAESIIDEGEQEFGVYNCQR